MLLLVQDDDNSINSSFSSSSFDSSSFSTNYNRQFYDFSSSSSSFNSFYYAQEEGNNNFYDDDSSSLNFNDDLMGEEKEYKGVETSFLSFFYFYSFLIHQSIHSLSIHISIFQSHFIPFHLYLLHFCFKNKLKRHPPSHNFGWNWDCLFNICFCHLAISSINSR